jgi:tRNA threonylcarbamoyladenosine biosynthesis protein TsaB
MKTILLGWFFFMLLLIESSAEVCSVALARLDAAIISVWEFEDAKSHSEYLTVMIEALLKALALEKTEIKAIAVAIGPGSYTGLRIGLSVAKGLAYALSCPLIAAPTLNALANAAQKLFIFQNIDEWVFIPMLDARRMEVYYTIIDPSGNVDAPPIAEVVDNTFFEKLPCQKKWCFVGNGAHKVSPFIKELQLSEPIILSLPCSARFLAELALDKYHNQAFEDIYSLEPVYLKSFSTTKPKPKL